MILIIISSIVNEEVFKPLIDNVYSNGSHDEFQVGRDDINVLVLQFANDTFSLQG